MRSEIFPAVEKYRENHLRLEEVVTVLLSGVWHHGKTAATNDVIKNDSVFHICFSPLFPL